MDNKRFLFGLFTGFLLVPVFRQNLWTVQENHAEHCRVGVARIPGTPADHLSCYMTGWHIDLHQSQIRSSISVSMGLMTVQESLSLPAVESRLIFAHRAVLLFEPFLSSVQHTSRCLIYESKQGAGVSPPSFGTL